MLGSTLFAVDKNGETVSHTIYDPWGAPLTETYIDENFSGLDNVNNFTGYTYDEVLALYFAQNRFYDADTHRFTQEDIIKDGENWYVYCGNNPGVNTDPSGLAAGGDRVLTDTVNFRATPNGSIKYTLSKGTKVYYTGTKQFAGDHNWAKCTYNNDTGWIADDFLAYIQTESSPTPPTPPTPTTGDDRYVKEDGVNFRSEPSINPENIITALSKNTKVYYNGTKVPAVGETWQWASCTYNGTAGWISDKYLVSSPAPTSNPGSTPPPPDYNPGAGCDTGTGSGMFRWPFENDYSIGDNYMIREIHPVSKEPLKWHKGLDINAPANTAILACADGTVSLVDWEDRNNHSAGWGYYIMIYHNSTYTTLYAHCSSATVTSGQNVKSGDIIGYVGSTGAVTGPHLHLELWKNGVASDEVNYSIRYGG